MRTEAVAAGAPAALGFVSVTKAFGGAVAADAVDLAVGQGRFVALVGPSGCGKTTLLRLAAGFLAPDRGRVEMDGSDAGATPPSRRGVGFVFQSYALFPTQTVAQNIGFAMLVRGKARARIRARVEELCALVGLDGLGARYPHELSGGQQQRVALARALAAAPPLLLLDEPLAALDAAIRVQLRAEIGKIVRDLGVAALYVTHDQEEALAMADEVAVMRAGRLAQVGPPGEVYLRPADPFVARFIGAANLLPCRRDGPSGVDLAGLRLPARIVRAPGAAEDAPARLALRPEHVEIADAGAPGFAPATLTGAVFLGPVVRLALASAAGPLTADAPAADWLDRRAPVGAALGWRPRAGRATAFVGFGAEA